MSKHVYTPEERKALSDRMRAWWAALSPEDRAACSAKFSSKDRSANAHRQMVKFWAECTGEARAKRCAHLTNPEAQAKSHEAQRTPEFRKRRSAWSKAAWTRLTDAEKQAQIELRRKWWNTLPDSDDLSPEEIAAALAARRKAVGQFLVEQRRKRRIGVVPVLKETPSPAHQLTEGEVRAREWEKSVRHLMVGRRLFRRPMPIVFFANETGEIARYASIPDAAQQLVAQGRSASVGSAMMAISQVCNGYRWTALGGVWCYDWERCGISTKGQLFRVIEWEKGIKRLTYRKKLMRAKTGKHPLIGFAVRSDDTPDVVRFPSLREAAKECVRLGLSKSVSGASSAICQSLRRRKTSMGFVWSYDWEALPLHAR